MYGYTSYIDSSYARIVLVIEVIGNWEKTRKFFFQQYVDPGDDSDLCEVCDEQFCKKCVALHVELCKIKDM